MAKLRVYELARDLNITNKNLLEILEELDEPAANHMSALDHDKAELVKNYIRTNNVINLESRIKPTIIRRGRKKASIEMGINYGEKIVNSNQKKVSPQKGLSEPPYHLYGPTKTSKKETSQKNDGLKGKNFKIDRGATGWSYDRIFGDYLRGAKSVKIENTYIDKDYQMRNLVRFCELIVKVNTIKKIEFITNYRSESEKSRICRKLKDLKKSLGKQGVVFNYDFDNEIHDRIIQTDNGWCISIGRGLDIYRFPENRNSIGAFDLELRPCKETRVNIYRAEICSEGKDIKIICKKR